ncbi:MAG TPA: hypothetical protein VGO34_13940 [Alphaproteobacteria bacterium]|jgi:hypothetical protein
MSRAASAAQAAPGRFASGEREAIIEFHRVGNAVKVSAVDPVSMTEVSIVAPATLGQRLMSANVLRKLDYVMARAAERG